MKIGTTRVNEQIGHGTAVAVIRDDNLWRLSLHQTANLAGGGPLRLIGGATNEWQISRGAAPHARHDTRCLFLSGCCWNLNQTADIAGGGPLRSIGGATNKWQISRGAAPHARHDKWQILRGAAPHARHGTRCRFLDHNCIPHVKSVTLN
jgi:hypothetical protein